MAEFGRVYAAALLAGDEVAAGLTIREALDVEICERVTDAVEAVDALVQRAATN